MVWGRAASRTLAAAALPGSPRPRGGCVKRRGRGYRCPSESPELAESRSGTSLVGVGACLTWVQSHSRAAAPPGPHPCSSPSWENPSLPHLL